MHSQLERFGNNNLGGPTRPTKRQRLGYNGQSPSSPRRLSTPVPPDRLTFPPGHQEPDLSRSDDGYQNGTAPPNERPGTSRFKQKYMYNPPETSQSRQEAGAWSDQTRRISRPGQPPPLSQQRQTHRSHHHGHNHAHTHHTHKHHKVMPPPPTPRSHAMEMPPSSTIRSPPVSTSESVPFLPTHLVPANNVAFQRSVPITPTNAPQRFIPPPSVSRLNTTANRHSVAQGHRMPFIPDGT